MKKRLLTLALVLALCLGLAHPALAYDTGKAGQTTPLSAGYYDTGFVDASGTLWMWGLNWRGQLGNRTTTISPTPVKVMDNVAAVSCGVSYTAAIKTDGTLWMWGNNPRGQLGNRTTTISPTPVKVMDNVAAVSCGASHTAAIKTDGTLWMWGDNSQGQLDNRIVTDSLTSIPIKVMDNVAAVSCGSTHTAAIKTDGTLWTWGGNDYGQLGNGTTKKSPTPIKVMDNAAAVSCGGDHTAAVKTDGTLWMWGYNTQGQLGNGTTTHSSTPIRVMDNVAAVNCGDWHTAAIKTDGTLWIWGNNYYGQLGNGTFTGSPTSIKVTDNVAAVSCGAVHTAAIKTDGTVWAWGSNREGQVGNGGYGNAVAANGGVCQTAPTRIMGLTAPLGVRLHLNGGTGGGQLWSNTSGTITVPTNPTKEGYSFGGWYTDAALTVPWNFDNKVTSGLTLYAKWVPLSSSSTVATENPTDISVDGTTVTVNMYRLIGTGTGGDVNYIRLRDLAALLDGTTSQFNVDWRNGTIYVQRGVPYTTRVGTELMPIIGSDGTFRLNTAPVLFDGVTTALEGIVITDRNGGGNTYFKLRDLCAAVGCNVGWDPARGGIYIEPGKPYSGTN